MRRGRKRGERKRKIRKGFLEKQVFKWSLGVGRMPIRGGAGKDTPGRGNCVMLLLAYFCPLFPPV